MGGKLASAVVWRTHSISSSNVFCKIQEIGNELIAGYSIFLSYQCRQFYTRVTLSLGSFILRSRCRSFCSQVKLSSFILRSHFSMRRSQTVNDFKMLTRVKWLAFTRPQSGILGQHWVLKSVNSVLSPAFGNRFQGSFQICVARWVFVMM